MSDRPVIWIASYPKSGNTWLRFLLVNLLYGPQQDTRLLEISVPDIHKHPRCVDVAGEGALVVKSHFAWSEMHPCASRTSAALYLVRDAYDVFWSNFNYYCYINDISTETKSRENVLDRYLKMYLEHGGDPRWLKMGFGTWHQNVVSWIAHNPFPVHLVYYEKMHANPVAECARIARFLKVEESIANIRAAVEASSFTSMKILEEKEIRENAAGFFGTGAVRQSLEHGNRFMNKGVVGDGRGKLDDTRIQKFNEVFGEGMKLLGYQLESRA